MPARLAKKENIAESCFSKLRSAEPASGIGLFPSIG